MTAHPNSVSLTPGRQLINEREVLRRVGFSRSTLQRRTLGGEFPMPVQTGPNSKAWFEDEVDHWMESRPRRFCAPPAGAQHLASKRLTAPAVTPERQSRSAVSARPRAARRHLVSDSRT